MRCIPLEQPGQVRQLYLLWEIRQGKGYFRARILEN